jgi:hypothetical protein
VAASASLAGLYRSGGRGSNGVLDPRMGSKLCVAFESQRFLDISQNDDLDSLASTDAPEAMSSSDDWFSLLNPDPWNLEMGFWSNLGEHSLFSNMDPALQAFQ